MGIRNLPINLHGLISPSLLFRKALQMQAAVAKFIFWSCFRFGLPCLETAMWRVIASQKL